MKIIGLTGGVGMGKSVATQILAQRGISIIDTDLLARELVEPGQPALVEISETFGSEILNAQGQLDRAALARVVFADAAKRRVLEEILHPRIRQAWQDQVDQWHRADPGRKVVVVIPLLFETGAETAFDSVICVACSAATQASRLAARGWTWEHQQQRITAQWPIQRKMDQATAVVWTESSLEVHEAQIGKILEAG